MTVEAVSALQVVIFFSLCQRGSNLTKIAEAVEHQLIDFFVAMNRLSNLPSIYKIRPCDGMVKPRCHVAANNDEY